MPFSWENLSVKIWRSQIPSLALLLKITFAWQRWTKPKPNHFHLIWPKSVDEQECLILPLYCPVFPAHIPSLNMFCLADTSCPLHRHWGDEALPNYPLYVSFMAEAETIPWSSQNSSCPHLMVTHTFLLLPRLRSVLKRADEGLGTHG